MSVVKYETHKCTVCVSAEALNVRAGGTVPVVTTMILMIESRMMA